MGAAATAVRADLATYDGVEELYDAVRAAGRPLEALAVNAGVGVSGDFAGNDLAAELRLVNLNVTSAVHLTRLVLPHMVEQGGGRVLITSSIAATMPGPYHATYAASKAFLYSFAEAIRHELRETGVTVTALMPGKDHVVAGSLKNRAQATAAKVLPETAKAKAQARMTEPGSARDA